MAVAKPTSSSTASPFIAQRRQQRGDLRVARLAGKDLLHRRFGFHAREVFAG